MAEIRVKPLLPADIPDVAAYLAGLRRDESPAGAPFDLAAETRALEARVRWQLVDNPARLADEIGGHVLRDAEGRVVGTHLAIPVRFVLDARPLLGLLSADLRAEPRAARHSGGMFFAYLRMRGADFHFATTANRNAGAFWEQRGAGAVAGSELEFIAPVRTGPFLEEIAARRTTSSAVARLAGLAGGAAGWLLRARALLARPPSIRDVAVSACADWERLAALAARHREPGSLGNERSAAYLRWRHASAPGSERNRVFLVDQRGQQAFVALQLAAVGAGRRRLREARLMDVVWPRAAIDAATVLRAAFERCRGECDMIRIKGGTVPADVARRLGFWQRRLDGPTSYVAGVGPDRAPLAPRARLVAADSDTP
jgi:hypothetical protein